MALGYCTGCQTEVTVRQGACLLGHAIDPNQVVERRGRHAASTLGSLRLLSRSRIRSTHHPGPNRPGDARRSRPGLALFDLLGFAEEPAPPQSAPAKPVRSHYSLSSVRRDPTDDTGTLIARLLTAAPAEEPPAWRPSSFLSLPGRRFRWTVLGWTAGLALILLIGSLLLARGPSTLEAKLLADHRERAAALASVLPEVETAARNLDDPASVAASTAALAQLEEAARNLFDVAAAESSQTSTGNTLGRIQERAGDAAAHAMQLEKVLGDALAYQLSLHTLLAPPTLPATAEPTAVADLAGRLSSWTASIARFDQSAPAAPQLAGTRTSVAAWSGWLIDWQVEYLDALRAGDEPLAERLRTDLGAAIAEVETAARADVASVEEWATATISDLVSDLEALQATS